MLRRTYNRTNRYRCFRNVKNSYRPPLELLVVHGMIIYGIVADSVLVIPTYGKLCVVLNSSRHTSWHVYNSIGEGYRDKRGDTIHGRYGSGSGSWSYFGDSFFGPLPFSIWIGEINRELFGPPFIMSSQCRFFWSALHWWQNYDTIFANRIKFQPQSRVVSLPVVEKYWIVKIVAWQYFVTAARWHKWHDTQCHMTTLRYEHNQRTVENRMDKVPDSLEMRGQMACKVKERGGQTFTE